MKDLESSLPRYSIVLPVHNESELIGPTMRQLVQVAPGAEILVCYDRDEDSTLPALSALPQVDRPDGLRLVKNSLGPGVRNAIVTGFEAARAPVVVVMMADLSDDLGRLEEMVARVEAGADVACASRYMPGGRQIGGPWLKGWLSRLAGLSLHWLVGLPTSDPTNSYKAYRRSFLARTPVESTAGFCLALELTVKAHFSGGRVEQVPATWHDRTAGQSRFRLLAWLPHYLRWYLWAFRRRFGPGRAPGERAGS